MTWFAASSTTKGSSAGRGRLLDEALLAALHGLSLPRRRVRGALPGEHAGSQAGRGEDFFQHRGYVRGEDLRSIDWRASGRTGTLLVKERHRPLRQPLALLVDASASMDLPPGASKARCAKKLAAGLALLGLRRGDPVSVFGLSSSANPSPISSVFIPRGRAVPGGRATTAAEELIGRIESTARADAAAALAAFPAGPLLGAQAVILSDLYGDESAFTAGVGSLVRAGVAVTVLHVLSAEERALPSRTSAVRDVETGEERAIAPGEAAAMAARVEAWESRLRAAAGRAGAEWLSVDPSVHPAVTLRKWLSDKA